MKVLIKSLVTNPESMLMLHDAMRELAIRLNEPVDIEFSQVEMHFNKPVLDISDLENELLVTNGGLNKVHVNEEL